MSGKPNGKILTPDGFKPVLYGELEKIINGVVDAIMLNTQAIEQLGRNDIIFDNRIGAIEKLLKPAEEAHDIQHVDETPVGENSNPNSA